MSVDIRTRKSIILYSNRFFENPKALKEYEINKLLLFLHYRCSLLNIVYHVKTYQNIIISKLLYFEILISRTRATFLYSLDIFYSEYLVRVRFGCTKEFYNILKFLVRCPRIFEHENRSSLFLKTQKP